MILELSMMAIVVSGGSHAAPPPPPATASQQACKYSIRETSDTYVCYTEQEYQQKQATEDKRVAERNKATGAWFGQWWWALLIVAIVVIGVMILGGRGGPSYYY